MLKTMRLTATLKLTGDDVEDDNNDWQLKLTGDDGEDDEDDYDDAQDDLVQGNVQTNL